MMNEGLGSTSHKPSTLKTTTCGYCGKEAVDTKNRMVTLSGKPRVFHMTCAEKILAIIDRLERAEEEYERASARLEKYGN